MNPEDRIYGLVSLAKKAGKIAGGAYMVETSIKNGKSRLVILAGDISERSGKHFKDMCSYRHVPVYAFSDMEALGHAIGKEYRAAVSVNDDGFAKAIKELLLQMCKDDMGGNSADGKKDK
jgi:ribosomal protein L7Ae-like RNA K-turn-binding protein